MRTPGGTEGSVVNHVAFRVPSFAPVEAAGLTVARLPQFPGVGSVMSPEGERIELFEDTATNLTFTPDGGPATGSRAATVSRWRSRSPFTTSTSICPTRRPCRGQGVVRDLAVGGVPGKRAQYDAVDLPGINLNFSAGPKAVVPTKGRTLDHLAFEVVRLRAFCTRLAEAKVAFERPCEGRAGAAQRDHCGPLGHVD